MIQECELSNSTNGELQLIQLTLWQIVYFYFTKLNSVKTYQKKVKTYQNMKFVHVFSHFESLFFIVSKKKI